MTREELKAYRSVKAEIKELECKLNERMICGEGNNKHDKTRERYLNRMHKLTEECEKTEEFIEEIEDSLTRRIFRMYYIDGKTQNEIARQINRDRSIVSRKLNAPDLY